MNAFRQKTDFKIRAALAALVTGGLISASIYAEDRLPATEPPLEKVELSPSSSPRFMVHAKVNHDSLQYQEGDELVVSVKCEEEAYLYVVYEQADGRQFLIFPNAAQPQNKMSAVAPVQVPAPDDKFRWVVTSPYGNERVRVIASKAPLKSLSSSELKSKRFNPLPRGIDKGIRTELRDTEHRDQFAEDYVELESRPKTSASTTSPGNTQESASASGTTVAQGSAIDATAKKPRRLGVFFGVSHYEFDAEVRAASESKHGLDLAGCKNDAEGLAKVMLEVGGIDVAQVFTNERATRRNMEAAITEWLASESHPGDTVVIYFSGHGSTIPDESGDEKDGRDETLVPYDVVPPEAVAARYALHKEGKLTGEQTRRLAGWIETIESGGKLGYAHLHAETAVTDDLFGHWLQRLAGRRIVVILDSCFSGGFVTDNVTSDSTNKPFDFLDGELQRLKDIDQPETAIMTASRSFQQAQAHENGEFGVMTGLLIEKLRKSNEPVTLDQVYTFCFAQMRQYFAILNEYLSLHGQPARSPHQPTLTSHCSTAIVLKP